MSIDMEKKYLYFCLAFGIFICAGIIKGNKGINSQHQIKLISMEQKLFIFISWFRIKLFHTVLCKQSRQ